eukprot:TRINITY_DN7739_c0_g1_i1.p1 TRINITY_DN7739_c0_g1~~TRINITY_DN7739_c0_g1_i1.p1  ORF type:complete len:117 (-),score=17.90 TRINITY_DN7739_c0_g1_i1:48-398(-)
MKDIRTNQNEERTKPSCISQTIHEAMQITDELDDTNSRDAKRLNRAIQKASMGSWDKPAVHYRPNLTYQPDDFDAQMQQKRRLEMERKLREDAKGGHLPIHKLTTNYTVVTISKPS